MEKLQQILHELKNMQLHGGGRGSKSRKDKLNVDALIILTNLVSKLSESSLKRDVSKEAVAAPKPTPQNTTEQVIYRPEMQSVLSELLFNNISLTPELLRKLSQIPKDLIEETSRVRKPTKEPPAGFIWINGLGFMQNSSNLLTAGNANFVNDMCVEITNGEYNDIEQCELYHPFIVKDGHCVRKQEEHDPNSDENEATYLTTQECQKSLSPPQSSQRWGKLPGWENIEGFGYSWIDYNDSSNPFENFTGNPFDSLGGGGKHARSSSYINRDTPFRKNTLYR